VENNTSNQYVDPEVTLTKFEAEFQAFKRNEDTYRAMGVVFLKRTPDSANFLFSVPHIIPQPIAFGVKIDYKNWDAEPPSIQFIDPFSERPLSFNEVKIGFFQKTGVDPFGQPILINLLQQSEPPFICIPGVKEYHDHPAHSGDSWFLHRQQGEGELCTIIEQLYKHSVALAGGYNIQLNFNIVGINPDLNKLVR